MITYIHLIVSLRPIKFMNVKMSRKTKIKGLIIQISELITDVETMNVSLQNVTSSKADKKPRRVNEVHCYFENSKEKFKSQANKNNDLTGLQLHTAAKNIAKKSFGKLSNTEKDKYKKEAYNINKTNGLFVKELPKTINKEEESESESESDSEDENDIERCLDS